MHGAEGYYLMGAMHEFQAAFVNGIYFPLKLELQSNVLLGKRWGWVVMLLSMQEACQEMVPFQPQSSHCQAPTLPLCLTSEGIVSPAQRGAIQPCLAASQAKKAVGCPATKQASCRCDGVGRDGVG